LTNELDVIGSLFV